MVRVPPPGAIPAGMMPHPIRRGRPARISASRRPSHIPRGPTGNASVILLLDMDPGQREVAGDSALDSLANASCQAVIVSASLRTGRYPAQGERQLLVHVANTGTTVTAFTDTNLAGASGTSTGSGP